MFRPRFLLGLILAGLPACAQQYIITTIAGGAPPVTPTAAAGASIGDPPRVAVDAAGNVYFASIDSVFKVDHAGTLTRLAGTGRYGISGDGAATSAQLAFPEGLAVDAGGDVYVAEHDANRIRKISADGAISTFAGTGTAGFSGDGGLAASAQFRGPTGLGIDSAGNLYVADTGNSVIRKISPGGVITTVAGSTELGYGGDGGPATQADLNGPEGVAADAAGNLYIADTFNHRIRKVALDGTMTTFAGNGYPGYGGDNGPATGATVELPTDVTVDQQGGIFIADLGSSRIRKVTNGIISTAVGTTNGQTPVGGQLADSVRLSGPTGVAVDSAGTIYFAEGSIGSGSGLDVGDFRIWKVTTDNVLAVAAGNGLDSFSGDGGPAILAQLNAPANVAVDSEGNLFVADSLNNRVRRISADGQIATVAGTGAAGFGGDQGPATKALLNQPMGVAVDAGGNLYIADTGNNKVRMVYPDGTIGTLAGNGNAAFFGDGGDALTAALHAPRAVAIDATGVLYVADTLDHRVRTIVDGIIDTVAGRGQGFGGDGSQASNALLNFPSSLTTDSNGNLYIADQDNGRIRKVSAAGIISTVADSLSNPQGVTVDRAGNVYVSEAGHNRIRKVAGDGTVTTVAGNGQCCYTNDGGPATSASLNSPWGIAADPSGNIYFADSANDAIRLLQPAPAGGVQGAVTNAASNLAGPIAPGEIVTIYGSGIGPAQPAQFQSVNSLGLVGPQLGGESVLFNGTFGPVLYASATQVTAIVPYSVAGPNVQIAVEYQRRILLTTAAALAATAPALFTMDASGRGQALAYNQDGSLNSATHPAAGGSVVTFLGTGEGQTTPAGVDGQLDGTPAPRPVAPVAVTIGGQPATVQYAGGSAGSVAGVLQINVLVPAGLPAGPVPVVVQAGGVSSPPGVTIVAGGS